MNLQSGLAAWKVVHIRGVKSSNFLVHRRGLVWRKSSIQGAKNENGVYVVE